MARPTSGNSASARQVTNRAIRIAAPRSSSDAWLGRERVSAGTGGPGVRGSRSSRSDRAAVARRSVRQVAGQRAVRAGLDQHVAQRGGLDRAGDDRQPAGVGGELAQQRVLRAAADDVDDVDALAGEPLRPARCVVGEAPREAVQDAADDLGRALRRGAARCAGRPSAIRGRHVAGRQERRVVRVEPRAAGRHVARPRRAARPGRRRGPCSSQVRSDSCSSHRPMTLRR